MVSIMFNATCRTAPYSYAERAQSTRPCPLQTVRASHARPGFVVFAVDRSKPDGFVVQERPRYAPRCVVDRLCHGGMGQLCTRYITNNQQAGRTYKRS